MKYKVVTCFNEETLNRTGNVVLNQFKDLWSPDIEFHCYHYQIDISKYSLPTGSNIFYHDIEKMEEYAAFSEEYAENDGTEGGQIPYQDILDPHKYFPRVLALSECAFTNADAWMIWIDPDVIVKKKITVTELDKLFPEGNEKIDMMCLEDSGHFVAYNLARETAVELLGDFRGAFISGEFLNYREWHDSFILNRLRTIYVAHGMRVHEITNKVSYVHDLFACLRDRKNVALRDKEGNRIIQLSDTETSPDILPNRYRQLADLIRFYKPSTILETGTWNAGRAIEMALAAFDSTDTVHYTGFDLFEDATSETDALEFNAKPHNTFKAVEARLIEFQEHIKKKEDKKFSFELVKGNVRDTLPKFMDKSKKDYELALIGSGNSKETVEIEYQSLKDISIVIMDHYFTEDDDEKLPAEEAQGVKKVFDAVATQKLEEKPSVEDGWTVFDEKSTIRKYILPSGDKVADGGHTHLTVLLSKEEIEEVPDSLKRVPIIVHPRDSVSREYITNNIQSNMKLIGDNKWVTKHPANREMGIIVSAGPYLDYDALKEFIKDNPHAKILTVKHAYPHLLAHGIKPWGCVVLDPRPITGKSTHNIIRKDLFKNLDKNTKFFVASMTDPSVTELLVENKASIYGWHAYTDSLRQEKEQGTEIHNQQVKVEDNLGIPKGATLITGGTCAAMRAIGIFHTMGFRNIHLWGFDCCRDAPSDEEKTETTGDVEGGEVPKPKYIEVSVEDITYWTTGELLAMAQDCEKVFADQGMDGVLEFHGEDTMVADLWKINNSRDKRPQFKDYYND
jgi:hypothetical protein|tara:strand:+ start:734 stop:3109 length:2376 start_codon:yes stop_codon:yes gene_type:complete